MNNEELKAITSSIEEKLGKESSALIADDIGDLILKNNQIFESMQEKNEEINRLRDDKDKLIASNGKLLQQIPMAFEEAPKQESKEEIKSFNFRNAFDSKGNFKKQ